MNPSAASLGVTARTTPVFLNPRAGSAAAARAALAGDARVDVRELLELTWPLSFQLVPGCVLVVGPTR